jgi:hypothetical protein
LAVIAGCAHLTRTGVITVESILGLVDALFVFVVSFEAALLPSLFQARSVVGATSAAAFPGFAAGRHTCGRSPLSLWCSVKPL